MSIVLSTPMISNPSFEIPQYAPGTNNTIATGVVVKDWSLYVGPSSFPYYAGITNAMNQTSLYASYASNVFNGNQCLYLQTPSSSTIEESSYAQTTINGLTIGKSYVIKCYVAIPLFNFYNSRNANITIKINATTGDYTTGTIIYINSSISSASWTQITSDPFTATSSSTLMTVMNDGSLGSIYEDRTLLVDSFSIEEQTQNVNLIQNSLKITFNNPFYDGFLLRLKDPVTNSYVGLSGTSLIETTIENAITFRIKNDSTVYNNNLGAVALQAVDGTGYNNWYMRHAFYNMYCDDFVANNFDFAWVFVRTSYNKYVLYTYYSEVGKPSFYADYNGSNLKITNNIKQWIVDIISPLSVSTSNVMIVDFNNTQYEYPPVALTGSSTNITGQSYGNGTYIVTQGTFEGNDPQYEGWNAFDKYVGLFATRWSTNGGYDNVTGAVISSITTSPSNIGGSYNGDYLQITLPSRIKLLSYSIHVFYFSQVGYYVNKPASWVLFGTNDTEPSSTGNWYIIDTKTNVNWSSIELNFSCNINQRFKTYRIVVTKSYPYDNNLTIVEMRLFGN